MTQVGQLTIEQKDLLVGVMYSADAYYNPIQDCNDVWVLSQDEMDATTNPALAFVKSLPLIDWCKKPAIPNPTQP